MISSSKGWGSFPRDALPRVHKRRTQSSQELRELLVDGDSPAQTLDLSGLHSKYLLIRFKATILTLPTVAYCAKGSWGISWERVSLWPSSLAQSQTFPSFAPALRILVVSGDRPSFICLG